MVNLLNSTNSTNHYKRTFPLQPLQMGFNQIDQLVHTVLDVGIQPMIPGIREVSVQDPDTGEFQSGRIILVPPVHSSDFYSGRSLKHSLPSPGWVHTQTASCSYRHAVTG